MYHTVITVITVMDTGIPGRIIAVHIIGAGRTDTAGITGIIHGAIIGITADIRGITPETGISAIGKE